VLGEVVKKSKEGGAHMGAGHREVSSFCTSGREAVGTERRLAQPRRANLARPRVVTNPVQPRTTNPTQPRVVANSAQPYLGQLTQHGPEWSLTRCNQG
jgi:hypothetical protein